MYLMRFIISCEDLFSKMKLEDETRKWCLLWRECIFHLMTHTFCEFTFLFDWKLCFSFIVIEVDGRLEQILVHVVVVYHLNPIGKGGLWLSCAEKWDLFYTASLSMLSELVGHWNCNILDWNSSCCCHIRTSLFLRHVTSLMLFQEWI